MVGHMTISQAVVFSISARCMLEVLIHYSPPSYGGGCWVHGGGLMSPWRRLGNQIALVVTIGTKIVSSCRDERWLMKSNSKLMKLSLDDGFAVSALQHGWERIFEFTSVVPS